MSPEQQFDVIIIGAGASGLMCAATAGQRGRRVLVVDHARKPGNKIRMSGGGRCNFTNYDVEPGHYLCHNPHFVKSALSRFTQWDFLAMVQRHAIAFHERDHGQLFCDDSARAILEMLLAECREGGVALRLKCAIRGVQRREEGGFVLDTEGGQLACDSLVVASGGLSIPTMGATPFGYRLAEQFGIRVWPPTPGLVPFTLQPQEKARFAPLAGIALEVRVSCGAQSFRENLLITHRGLSGPAVLQLSSFWQPGETITIDWLPGHDLAASLRQAQRDHPRQQLKSLLGRLLPQRLVTLLLPPALAEQPLATLSHRALDEVATLVHHYRLRPGGTEGYRTAEVTVGGVDTDAISSKTMECRTVAGLYFIGEVLDVTGWLGGYNFQWAWSSGWCAGQYV